jgi:hypothetical protein
MAEVLLIGLLLAFVAFRQWMRHQRLRWMHEERLKAIEKGLDPKDLPQPDETISGKGPGARRFILLSGLIWLAIGLGSLVVASGVLGDPAQILPADGPPPKVWVLGIIPALVGVAHLVVFSLYRNGGKS